MRALITGVAGFAGSHLTEYLLTQPALEVHGVNFPGYATRNIEHLLSRVALHSVDLNVREAVRGLLEAVRPDLIFHLAAQASVGRAWANPAETLSTNVTMQLNLLQATVDLGLRPRILVIGSADEYGLVRDEDLPIDEDTPLRPASPYAVSKIAQDYLGYQYYLSFGLSVVRVRPFNHIGPRQALGFVVPDFAHQIVQIEAGRQEPVLHVGNLSAQRDLTDVRDMVRGYYLALTKGQPGEVYNLGSERAYSIREILERLLCLSGVSARVVPDPQRIRPSDIPLIVSDCRKLRAATGWQPEVDLDTTLRSVLADWREHLT